MTLRRAALVVVSIWTVALAAADVSGVWTVRLVTDSGQEAPTFVVTMHQQDRKLTGDCVTDDLDDTFPLTGEVDGVAIKWQCVVASFVGTTAGAGDMRGSWSTPTQAKGTFTGVKRR